MLKRKKPLPRNRKPISRKGKALVRAALPRQQQRIRAKGKSRFPKRRNPEYKAFIKTLPCVLLGRPLTSGAFVFRQTHDCREAIDPMHVKSRGAGADDFRQLVPCCHTEHARSHTEGIKSWAARWFPATTAGEPIDELRRIAAEVYPKQYEAQKALGWPE